MIEKALIGPAKMMSPQGTAPAQPAGAAEIAQNFAAFLNDALNKVDQQQQTVDQLNRQFISGVPTDVHQLMIAAEKAYLGLALTVEVRNKALEAYHEIMRMTV